MLARIRVIDWAGHGAMAVLCLVTLFPIYWMLVTSFRAPNEILGAGLLPTNVTFDNYIFAWTRIPLGSMLFNTVLMSLVISLAHLLLSILAGYAFARWTFPGDRALFLLFIGTWLIPLQVIMIPNYVMLSRLGWLNTPMCR